MKKKVVPVRLDEQLLNDLKLVGILEGCSVSFIIRTVVQDYMNYYMYKNNETKKIKEQ